MMDRDELFEMLDKAATERPPSTTRAYLKGWNDWEKFAVTHNLECWPADSDDLACWIAHIAMRLKPASVRLYARGVAAWHQQHDLPDPIVGRAAVALDQFGVPGEQRQARPLTGVEIPQLLDALPDDAHLRWRMRALLWTMRYAMLRRSEAAALLWSDWHPMNHGSVIVIRTSKTSKQPVDRWLPPRATGALELWLRVADTDDPRIFGWAPATIGKAISATAKACGLEGVTGHSLRRGMTVDLLAAGAPSGVVMEAGRWATEAMVNRYARGGQASRQWIEAVDEKVTV